MLQMEAVELTVLEDPFAVTSLLGEQGEAGVLQLENVPESFWEKSTSTLKRLWRKMFGRSPEYKFDNKVVMREMQEMSQNDLSEALLNGLEDVHDLGTPANPHPDGSYEPPEEFGMGDDGGVLEAPPEPADAQPNLFDAVIDTGLDAAVDAVAPVIDSALGAIPGFDAITDAVNRGASLMNPRQFAQDFADSVEFVPSGSGWTMSSTVAGAANVIGKLAATGGLMLAGGVATNYLNDLLPNLGDAVNWGGAVAMLSAGDPLALIINGAVQVFNTMAIAREKTSGRPDQGVRAEDWARPGGRQVVPRHPGE